MKPKTILNGAILFIGLGLAAYSQLNGYRLRFNVESVPVASATKDPEVATEVWQVKENSIYDGDTLRVVRGSERASAIKINVLSSIEHHLASYTITGSKIVSLCLYRTTNPHLQPTSKTIKRAHIARIALPRIKICLCDVLWTF